LDTDYSTATYIIIRAFPVMFMAQKREYFNHPPPFVPFDAITLADYN